MVKFLISQGASIECQTDNKYTPLYLAILKGHLDIVKYLISQGANINCKDNANGTPLHFASHQGNLSLVKFLISQGANIECQSNENYTPLHLATLKGHINIVKYLISQGANIDCINKAKSAPLQIAVLSNHAQMILLFISFGADKLKFLQSGFTIFHLSIILKNYDLLNFMINNGFNINFADKFHQTAFSYSDRKSESELIFKQLKANPFFTPNSKPKGKYFPHNRYNF